MEDFYDDELLDKIYAKDLNTEEGLKAYKLFIGDIEEDKK